MNRRMIEIFGLIILFVAGAIVFSGCPSTGATGITDPDDTTVPSVVLAGGVARNNRLRSTMQERMARETVDLYIPSPEFCTDNGAMIALAGYHRIMAGHSDELTLDARSRFPIDQV